MKRIALLLVVILVAAAAVAAPQRAPAPGRGPAPQHGALLPPEALAEFLELTESQIAQIEVLRQALKAQLDPLIEQQRENQKALDAALQSGNALAIGEAMLALQNIRNQIKAAHDAFAASFEALLTPSQKTKWDIYQEILALRSRQPQD